MRMSLRTSTLALALLGSAAFLTTPCFAVEPDVNSPAGAELPAPGLTGQIFNKMTNLELS